MCPFYCDSLDEGEAQYLQPLRNQSSLSVGLYISACLCFGLENKSSKLKKKIKFNNLENTEGTDHHTCRRHQLNKKRHLCLRCRGHRLPSVPTQESQEPGAGWGWLGRAWDPQSAAIQAPSQTPGELLPNTHSVAPCPLQG